MTTARESIRKLATILRHIDILSQNELNIDDIDDLKYYLRMWASTARNEGYDALAPLVALVEAIEEGIDISELQEYQELRKLAPTKR